MSLSKRLSGFSTIAFLVGALAIVGLAPGTSAAQQRHHKGAHAAKGKFQLGLGQRHRVLGPRKRRSSHAKQTASATPSTAGLLFRGDQMSDYPVRQSAPGGISEAPDPAGSGQTVFKMTVSDNDGYPVTPTENPRAEMLSPATITSGQEIWWSAKFFLPADFPASTPNFVTLLQGPYGHPWSGTPPFHIEANGGVLKWQRNNTYGWDIPWQMPLVRNQWVNVLIHERFASDGYVEMWINGQQQTFFGPGSYNPDHVAPTPHLEMATLDSSNNASPNSIYLQSYRKKGMFPSLTIFQGPLSIGTTRAAVES